MWLTKCPRPLLLLNLFVSISMQTLIERRNGYGMIQQGRLRMVVADAHPAFAHGLSALAASTSSDLAVVGTVSELSALFDLLTSHTADVLVLDKELLGEEEPGSVLQSLAKSAPGMSVLLLYPRDGAPGARKALEAGARGLLNKAASPNEIFSAVRAVAAGEVVMVSIRTGTSLRPCRTGPTRFGRPSSRTTKRSRTRTRTSCWSGSPIAQRSPIQPRTPRLELSEHTPLYELC
jgi:DNA-binding NarL/FixJ family response regulator